MAVEIRVQANTRDAEQRLRRLNQGVEGLADSAADASRSLTRVGPAVQSATRGTQNLAAASRQAAGAAGDFMRSSEGASRAIRNLGSVSNRRGIEGVQDATERTADAAERSADSFERSARSLRNFVNIAAGLATAYIAVRRGILGSADALTRINSQLQLVSDSTSEAVAAQRSLTILSRETRTTLAGTAQLYGRFARAGRTLGRSQEEIVAVTENVNRAITISGASAASANAAIIQLGQGLAAGALRGEELNSVLEQTPRVARAIADGLGVSIGRLRQLGAEGALTAESVFDALRTQGAVLREEFGQVTLTFEQATQRIGEALTLIGAGIARNLGRIFFSITESTRDIGIVLERFADNFDMIFDDVILHILEFRVAFRQAFASVANIVRDSSIGRALSRAFAGVSDGLGTIDLSSLVPSLDEAAGHFERAFLFVDRLFDRISSGAGPILSAAAQAFASFGTAVIDAAREIWEATFGGSFLRRTFEGISDGVSGMLGLLPDISSFADSFVNAAQRIFNAQDGIGGLFSGGRAELVVTQGSPVDAGNRGAPLAVRIISGVVDLTGAALNVLTETSRGTQRVLGELNFAALTGAIVLLNNNLRGFATQGGLAGLGRTAAGAVEGGVLSRNVTNLAGQVAALERIAGVSSGRVTEVNNALTLLAERSGRQATDRIREFERRLLSVGPATPVEEINSLQAELNDLGRGLNATARAALDAELRLRQATTADQARAQALGQTALLTQREERLAELRRQQAASITRINDSIRGFLGGAGGAVGGVAGFTLGQQFVDYLNENGAELSAWQEAGISIASAFAGQAAGAFVGNLAGSAIGFVLGPLIASGIASAAAALATAGGVIATGFAAAQRILAGVGAIMAAGFAAASAVITAIGGAIAAAAATAFAGLGFGSILAAGIVGAFGTGLVVAAIGAAFTTAIVSAFTGGRGREAITNAFGGGDAASLRDNFGSDTGDNVLERLLRGFRFLATGQDGGGGQTPGFRSGGRVRGPGTGRSDSINARLSNGEFVVNAAATRNNLPLLSRINGGIGNGGNRFQQGGLVGNEADILRHLREFEGFVPHIYTDSRGFPTIGIGHLLTGDDIGGGRFFNSDDPLTTLYRTLTQNQLGTRFDSRGLQSRFLPPSVQLSDSAANQLALSDYGNNLGTLLSNDRFNGLYQGLPGVAQQVLADLAFNVGPSILSSFPGFARALGVGDFSRAAGELRDSAYYYQTRRRARANIDALGMLDGGVDDVGISPRRLSRLWNDANPRAIREHLAVPLAQGGLGGIDLSQFDAGLLERLGIPPAMVTQGLPTRAAMAIEEAAAEQGSSVFDVLRGLQDFGIPARRADGELLSRILGVDPGFQAGGLIGDLDEETRSLISPSARFLIEDSVARANRIGEEEAARAQSITAQQMAGVNAPRGSRGIATPDQISEEAQVQRRLQSFVGDQAGSRLESFVNSNYGGLIEDIESRVEASPAASGALIAAAFAGGETATTDGSFGGVNYQLGLNRDGFSAAIDTMLGGGVLSGNIDEDGRASVNYNRSIGRFANLMASADSRGEASIGFNFARRFRDGGLAGKVPGFQEGGLVRRFFRAFESDNEREAREALMELAAVRGVSVEELTQGAFSLDNIIGGVGDLGRSAASSVGNLFGGGDSDDDEPSAPLARGLTENTTVGRRGLEAVRSRRMRIEELLRGFQGGGRVSGPGGPRDDEILARLSNGEFVVNAEATRENLPLLEELNGGLNVNGRRGNRSGIPRFQLGGLVEDQENARGNAVGPDSQSARDLQRALAVLAARQEANTRAIEVQTTAITTNTDTVTEVANEQMEAMLEQTQAAVVQSTTQQPQQGTIVDDIENAVRSVVQASAISGQAVDPQALTSFLAMNTEALDMLVPLLNQFSRAQAVVQGEGGIGRAGELARDVQSSTGSRLASAVQGLGSEATGQEGPGFGEAGGENQMDFLSNFSNRASEAEDVGATLGQALGQSFTDTFEAISSTLSIENAAANFSSNIEQLAAEGSESARRIAIASAAANLAISVSSGFAAIGQALASPPGPPFNLGTVAIVTAQALANVANARSALSNAQSVGLQTGGFVSGPGTGTSDSVSANLSNGEYVVRSDQAGANRDLLESINNGTGAVGGGGGGYVASQSINVEVGGVARSARQTADTVVPAVLDAINQTNRDRTAGGARRRPR